MEELYCYDLSHESAKVLPTLSKGPDGTMRHDLRLVYKASCGRCVAGGYKSPLTRHAEQLEADDAQFTLNSPLKEQMSQQRQGQEMDQLTAERDEAVQAAVFYRGEAEKAGVKSRGFFGKIMRQRGWGH